MVFLWIKENDPNTLYYHLAEPNEEVSTNAGLGFHHPLTAISQLFSFCLLFPIQKTESALERYIDPTCPNMDR